MDVKKIGRIPDGGGWRAHGREMGSTAIRKRNPVGYDYVHSVVDDHSRLAYSEILADEQAATCSAFFARALARFAAHNITIEAVMTDNHWSYTKSSSLAQLLTATQIKHVRIKPHCPWQNGKVCEHDGGAAPGRSDPGQGVTAVSFVRFVGRSRCCITARTGQTELT
jgi:hypothetical protein